MKKILLVAIALLTFSCNKDEDEGCKCQGEFKRINNDPSNSFYIGGVDCLTGEPGLSQQNAGSIGQTNPAYYIGCNN